MEEAVEEAVEEVVEEAEEDTLLTTLFGVEDIKYPHQEWLPISRE